MSRLKITQGPLAGKTLGECAPRWQEKFVRSLYGNTGSDGRRLCDEVFLLVGKKSGKSTLTGMLAVAHTLCFPEQRGAGVLLADTREQARLVFDSMAATVRADPFLAKQFHVRDYKHEVEHRPTGTVVKAIASELASTVGTQPSFYVCDELHLLGLRPKGAHLVRQLSSGAAVRANPLGVYITTAPVDVASGIYQSMLNRARRVTAGEAPGDRLFPVLFELPPDVDPDDPKWWWHANPSMGTTFSLAWLKREHGIAQQDPDPSALTHFYSQHLNLAAGETLGIDRWLPLAAWDRCKAPGITLDTLVSQCEDRLWLSIDAGGRDDPTCLGVLGETEDSSLLWWAHQWLHTDGYERRRAAVPLDDFVQAGDLTLVSEDNGDLAALQAMADTLRPHVVAVGVDPYGLREVVRDLESKGVTVHGIPQGWRMTPFIHEAARAVHGGKLQQYGGPLMRWNIENCRLEERGEAVALTKPSGASVGSKKIDGAVALVMALAAHAETPAKQRSVYKDRGLLAL
jgi:phage terminase large subunit-like protein